MGISPKAVSFFMKKFWGRIYPIKVFLDLVIGLKMGVRRFMRFLLTDEIE